MDIAFIFINIISERIKPGFTLREGCDGSWYGKDVGFGIGLMFLQPIFVGILAFDSSSYYGPDM